MPASLRESAGYATMKDRIQQRFGSDWRRIGACANRRFRASGDGITMVRERNSE